MTRILLPLLLLLVCLVPAHADEDPPAEEPTEEQREAALTRALDLSQRAKTLAGQGRYGEAIPIYREVLAIREKVLGSNHTHVAASLSHLGDVLQLTGDYRAALPLLERAARIYESEQGTEHANTGKSLNNLAGLLRSMGRYEQARVHSARALPICEKALGPDHPSVGYVLLTMGGINMDTGRLEEARPLYERALAIHEKAFGPDHTVVATSVNDLALLLRETGRYEEALPLFERALAINEKARGRAHPCVAAGLTNLAFQRGLLGQSERARPLYERALRICAESLGPDHPILSSTLTNYAWLLGDIGQYEQALRLQERALRITEKIRGPDHPYVAAALNSMSGLLRALGHDGRARSLQERALRIHEKALGPEHPLVGTSLHNLALLLAAEGDSERAWALQQRSHRITEKAFGSGHVYAAASLSQLATLLREAGRLEQAVLLQERALRINEGALGSEHPHVAWCQANLASLLTQVDQHERAGVLLGRCLDAVEQIIRRGVAGLQPSERRALARSLRSYLDRWLALAPRVGSSGYAEVLRFKGLLARAAAAERRLVRGGGAEATARVAELRAKERRLARLASTMPPLFQNKRHRTWQEAYAKAGAEREELALALARDFAPLREGLERLDLALEDIQAQLGPRTVLVDFLRSGRNYLAWVVRHEGDVERLDLGKAEAIEAAATEFAALAADRDSRVDAPAWAAAGRTLRELVLAPIQARLGEDVRTLYLSTDAALAAIPFACLPGNEPGRFLIDDVLLVQVSMAQDLVPRKDELPRGRGALALGDVDFRSASAGTSQPYVPTPRTLAAADRAPRGGTYAPLPETGVEVAFVRKRLGEECAVLLGPDATEAHFRAAAEGKRILHLATHGFVRDDLMRGLRRRKGDTRWLGASMERQLAVGYDPMLLSGLALAGANPRSGGHGDDGILTAAEASYLDLDAADLVVLSACETALGKAESGEGVIGLVQGFQMAGAKRVIASLWQVDDEATRLLMQHLYDGMLREKDPLSPAEALREAQLKVRNATGEGGQSFAHPRHWAGFVSYGR